MSPFLERIIGRLLRARHGRDAYLAWNDPRLTDVPDSITLRSPAFADGAPIPVAFAGVGVGDNVSPPLYWSGLPAGTLAVMILIEDPDAPLARPVVHLIAANISASIQHVEAGMLNASSGMDLMLGLGSFDRIGYAGPRPILGHGPHRYIFQIFALDRLFAFSAAPSLDALLEATRGAVLAKGRLIGTYERR